ncbi:ABC-type branched-subunit amino acid transport system permease subunit [Bradyrhizobium ottawaense]
MKSFTVSKAVTALMLAGLLLLPLYSQLSGNIFILTLFTRIIILALAAASLNLIMGFGGMMSFGHAAYLGIGGYAVGMLAQEGVGSGFIQFPVALAASALYALVIGALSLRTRGVYFIMITLAFAQMAYYVASRGWRATAAMTASPSTSAATSPGWSTCRTARSSIISASPASSASSS